MSQNVPNNQDNKNDYYIRNKKLFIKLSIISSVLLAVFLSLAVVFFILVRNQRIDYQTVQVEVTDVLSKSPLSRTGKNKVYVLYDNRLYELKSVKDSEVSGYKVKMTMNTPAKAYLADGELYSNIDAIRGHTIFGKVYFVFLFGSMGLIFSTAVLIGCVVEAKKREKGIYPAKYVNRNGPF